jgi:hypothetical protein
MESITVGFLQRLLRISILKMHPILSWCDQIWEQEIARFPIMTDHLEIAETHRH